MNLVIVLYRSIENAPESINYYFLAMYMYQLVQEVYILYQDIGSSQGML